MLDPSFQPISFEPGIYERWEENGDFKAKSEANKKSFLITMPPPNVTGALHMGHALFVSIQDTYTRWKRMLGYNTLWLPGTDHAGIATQVMVERQVESEGSSRVKLGREAFLKRVWDWKKEYGGTITEQIRALGSSCDWSRELFTLDTKSSLAVRESFTRLFHDGLIYRGERIVNWSSGLQTAISDLEVELKPVQGALYYLKYKLADATVGENLFSDSYILVATTRPETIFADVAVAVNPEDPRFKALHGKEVLVPLSNQRVPIILDSYVDMEFGTGALKITPGHDANDWQIGQRHKLKTISCIGKDGKLNELAGEFKGLFASKARKAVADKLIALGQMDREEKHNHEVGFCQRTGVVVEPLVSMQWFMRMEKLAAPALQAAQGEDPALRFYPDYWKKTYFEWLNNIQDWCISRQLWWGHQIPAWHCKACAKITVPKSSQDADPKSCAHCDSTDIEQDSDVLDTWYSSALWPISTLGWPNKTSDLEIFYPQLKANMARGAREAKALMETGSDILFFWVARMVMMCTYFMDGRIPFEDVFLHAMVRDDKGQKMSKTKGNVVDPLEITEKHGSDALRLTLLALSGQGRNVNLDLKRLEGYKSFLNKLWNASRFAMMQLDEAKVQAAMDPREHLNDLDFVDRCLLDSLDETVRKVNEHLTQYRPDAAFQEIYQFSWYEFCDWYLELVKLKNGKLHTLSYALETIMRLLHPMAPMVTEKISSELPWGKQGTIIHAQYPLPFGKALASPGDQKKLAAIKLAVDGIRNFRTENKIAPKQQILAYLETKEATLWQEIKTLVMALAKISDVHLNSELPPGLSGKVSNELFTFTFPLEGLVDKEGERTRLRNELKKAKADLDFSQKRLHNPAFLERAKPDLVAMEKRNADLTQEKIKVLEDALQKLS